MTPRRRFPKHEAQRAISGIQCRLRRQRRTATARHPYLLEKGPVARRTCRADHSEHRGFIPKAVCFWILVEEHSASRLCALACPLAPVGRVRTSRPVPTRPRRPSPLLFRCKVQFQRANGISPEAELGLPLFCTSFNSLKIKFLMRGAALFF